MASCTSLGFSWNPVHALCTWTLRGHKADDKAMGFATTYSRCYQLHCPHQVRVERECQQEGGTCSCRRRYRHWRHRRRRHAVQSPLRKKSSVTS